MSNPRSFVDDDSVSDEGSVYVDEEVSLREDRSSKLEHQEERRHAARRKSLDQSLASLQSDGDSSIEGYHPNHLTAGSAAGQQRTGSKRRLSIVAQNLQKSFQRQKGANRSKSDDSDSDDDKVGLRVSQVKTNNSFRFNHPSGSRESLPQGSSHKPPLSSTTEKRGISNSPLQDRKSPTTGSLPDDHIPTKRRFQMKSLRYMVEELKASKGDSSRSDSESSSSTSDDEEESHRSLESDDVGGDFLVDFPTNRQEIREQQRRTLSDALLDGSSHHSKRDATGEHEVDQRKPWRRPSSPRQASSSPRRDQFGSDFGQEDLNNRFEMDNDDSRRNYDDQSRSEIGDEPSIMSELMHLQEALGWKDDDNKSTNSKKSSNSKKSTNSMRARSSFGPMKEYSFQSKKTSESGGTNLVPVEKKVIMNLRPTDLDLKGDEDENRSPISPSDSKRTSPAGSSKCELKPIQQENSLMLGLKKSSREKRPASSEEQQEASLSVAAKGQPTETKEPGASSSESPKVTTVRFREESINGTQSRPFDDDERIQPSEPSKRVPLIPETVEESCPTQHEDRQDLARDKDIVDSSKDVAPGEFEEVDATLKLVEVVSSKHRKHRRRRKHHDGKAKGNDDGDGIDPQKRDKRHRKHNRRRSHRGEKDAREYVKGQSNYHRSLQANEELEKENQGYDFLSVEGIVRIPGDEDCFPSLEDSKEEEHPAVKNHQTIDTSGSIVPNMSVRTLKPKHAVSADTIGKAKGEHPVKTLKQIPSLGLGGSKISTMQLPEKNFHRHFDPAVHGMSDVRPSDPIRLEQNPKGGGRQSSQNIAEKQKSENEKHDERHLSMPSQNDSLHKFRSFFSKAEGSSRVDSFFGIWGDDLDVEANGGQNRKGQSRKANIKTTMRTNSWGLAMQRIVGPRAWELKWYILGGVLLLVLILGIAIPLSNPGGKSAAVPQSESPTAAPTFDVPSYNEMAIVRGDVANDEAGSSVALSRDGRFIAVGYPQTATAGGEVRVFERVGSGMLPYGDILRGGSAGDGFGYSVSISYDGQIVAVGAPTANDNLGYVSVFGYDSRSLTWMPLGESLLSSESNGRAGSSVALSGNGLNLAVGIPRANDLDGITVVYRYISLANVWARVGQSITGSNGELNGYSVSLDETGENLAIGAPRSPGSFQRRGRVYVLHYGNEWSQVGSAIAGYDLLGRSVSLSATGQRIAIGSTGFDNGLKEDVGACQVYGYLGDWIQFGASLRGQAEDERSGFAVALSSDGERIACGGPGDSVVRVYADNGKGAWEQIGETLSGIPSSNFGAAVALSDDGAFLAIGAPSESYLEPSVGAFRLYNE